MPPENEPDIPFVVKFQIYYPDETYTLEDDYEAPKDQNTPKDQFRFHITTRRLIEFSTNFTLVQYHKHFLCWFVTIQVIYELILLKCIWYLN